MSPRKTGPPPDPRTEKDEAALQSAIQKADPQQQSIGAVVRQASKESA